MQNWLSTAKPRPEPDGNHTSIVRPHLTSPLGPGCSSPHSVFGHLVQLPEGSAKRGDHHQHSSSINHLRLLGKKRLSAKSTRIDVVGNVQGDRVSGSDAVTAEKGKQPQQQDLALRRCTNRGMRAAANNRPVETLAAMPQSYGT